MPAAVDTKHWQRHIFEMARGVCFIEGRLHFLGGPSGPAPMACALVYYGDRNLRFQKIVRSLGYTEAW